MRIAYFTNQYPAVSHTFIKREIRALEALGLDIRRFALRPAAVLVDPDDIEEAKRTRFVLHAGAGALIAAVVYWLARRPPALFQALVDAIKMGWRSDRGILRNIAYVVEGALLAQWCRDEHVDHIHAHFGTNSAAIAMFASCLTGIPFSFTAHGSEEFEKAPLLSLDVKLRHAAFAVCVSSFGRSQLMRWSTPSQWDKIQLVYCALDDTYAGEHVQPVPDVSRFTCVGRLGEHKGQIVLVEAVRLLREEGLDCEVVLVGDGPMRADVEAAIRRAWLDEAVQITGWCGGDRVRAEMLGARAFILPSFSENMPVVIMEAMALGRPVISTYVAGIPELVKPGTTGWLVPSGDAQALAAAMREALAAPAEELAAMGAAGRLHILTQHNARKEASKLTSLFERARGAVAPAGRSARPTPRDTVQVH